MSEKMPVVSGKVLIRFLESLGYEVARQRGSHVLACKVDYSREPQTFYPKS